MPTVVARYPSLAIGLAIGLLFVAADLAGGQPIWHAGISLAFIAAYAGLVTVLGRRSETASVLAGRPVDERWEHINMEACAYAVAVSAVVALAAYLVADATGGDWRPYAFMAAIIALSYVGALIVLRARH